MDEWMDGRMDIEVYPGIHCFFLVTSELPGSHSGLMHP